MSPLKEEDREKVLEIVDFIKDKKGENVLVLDLQDHSIATRFFVIAHGDNSKHVRAIAENIIEEKETKPEGKEGMQEGDWVALDYGDVWVHLFQEDTRQFYDLEGLWADRKVSLG